MNGSDIDLDASYSDSDNEIPIREDKFWEYLEKLEDNNLFEMNLFQDRTKAVEKMELQSQKKIAARRERITDLDLNISQIKASLIDRKSRYSHYRSLLVDSNKGKKVSKSVNNKSPTNEKSKNLDGQEADSTSAS